MSAYIEVRYSDDGGHNFSRWKVLAGSDTGSFLKQLKLRRLGRSKEERIWEFRDTSASAAEILSASLWGGGQWSDFPLPDGSYSDDCRPFTQQDVCNYLPTFAEAQGTRSRLKHRPVPGLVAVAGAGNGPHRGGRDVEGKRFVVSGTGLYQLATDGTPTLLGTIPGTRRVSMTHNQVAGGNQLVIATGDNSYVWDTTTETLTATGVPLIFVDFINQLIVGIDVARRFWRYSGLADATSWNALDNESAESSPDRLVGVIVSQGEVLLFGERTIEVWSNSPTDTTAFQRATVIEKGCANGNTICRLDNTVYFVGNDSIPYRLQGYTPVPIGSKAITDSLSESDPEKLFAFTWEDKGYVVYYLTAQDGHTWGYDVTCQKWHRRESFGLDRWRVNTLFKWNGDWYAGDYSNGKVYKLVWGNVYDGCEIMPRLIRTGVMHNNGNPMFVHGLKLLANTGREPANAPTAPTISGAMPDATVGDVVSYQYTVTTVYPGQPYRFTATGLPSGLSISSTGLVTGQVTTAGTYTPVISLDWYCGEPVTLTDSVAIADSAQLKWWLTFNGTTGTDNKVWFSTDALTWSNQTTRSPNVDATYGLHWTGSRMVAYSGAQAETTADFDFSDGITTTLTTPTYPGGSLRHKIDAIDGVLITTGQANYSTSIDGGLNWVDHASPGGNTLQAIARLANGRWLGLTGTAANYFYYSDDADYPATWTLASVASTAHSPEYGIFSYGTGAFHVDNTQAIRRTTDGASWDYTAGLFPFTFGDASIQGATDGNGVWIIPGGSTRRVARSADNGLTWAIINMPGGAVGDSPRPNATKYGNGIFAVTYGGSGGHVYVSSDLGLTWTASTLPVTGEGGYPAVEYAG